MTHFFLIALLLLCTFLLRVPFVAIFGPWWPHCDWTLISLFTLFVNFFFEFRILFVPFNNTLCN
jgi:hypothetical protein